MRFNHNSNRERAKQVILEIVRQSTGDEIEGKAKIFKAFYLAHLFYGAAAAGVLTEWPIVKMPNGPGIDGFDSLTSELQQAGLLETEAIRVGPYPSTRYRAVRCVDEDKLPPAAVAAIRNAVEFVADKTSAQLTEITHELSRAWNQAEMGRELNIYLDLLSDEELTNNTRHASEVQRQVLEVFADM